MHSHYRSLAQGVALTFGSPSCIHWAHLSGVLTALRDNTRASRCALCHGCRCFGLGSVGKEPFGPSSPPNAPIRCAGGFGGEENSRAERPFSLCGG